jgi:exodeoxyribonuclease VII large subunit
VLLAPTLVQGLEAPPQIIQAIRWLDGRDDIELIIVARGGGSIEDLWAFNDEGVARAIFAARHPIISGVGHETDFTIADFVADLRAPTPSAAAELAVPDLSDLSLGLASTRDRLVKLLRGQLEQAGWQLQGLQLSLQYLSPLAQLDSYFQRVDSMQMRLERAINHTLERAGSMLALADSHLQAVNPAATLARGYAIVRHRDGRIVTSVSQVRKGDDLEIQVSDGSFGATAE